LRKEIGSADLGADWPGGYFCPCHQSKFDLSARVFKGMPAPTNLEVPSYSIAGTMLVIGDDSKV
jgi:ubiquinol-cytochrome c reductase iron-sulfur subunit